MTVSERLIDSVREIWEGYLRHPFVTGIGDGTLDEDKFRFYMIQDYRYLVDYARVFALGVAKAQTIADMRVFAAYVHEIMDVEMEIHRSYMKRLGIPEADAEQTPVSTVNAGYTAYMLRVAYDEGPAEIAASILACAVSYEKIAYGLLAEHPEAADHPFYGEWIRGYANEDYAAENRKLEAMLDRMTEGYSEERIQRLEEIFRICSDWETLFWDMAWEMK